MERERAARRGDGKKRSEEREKPAARRFTTREIKSAYRSAATLEMRYYFPFELIAAAACFFVYR